MTRRRNLLIVATVIVASAMTLAAPLTRTPILKALGEAEGLPKLPDFEFVLRRSRNSSHAADHLAEMIVNFFQLSKALRPDERLNYKQRSQLLLRPRLEP